MRTINRAAQMAQAGDTVLVGPGRYHEYIVVPNSGAAGKPITFRASGEGEAIVSAAHPLSGFAKTSGLRNVYETDLRAIFPATGELECYGLIDDTSLRAYVLLPSQEACDVVPASFALDSKARRLYVHTADSAPPAEHRLELSTKSATFYVSPAVAKQPALSDIVIDGFTIKHVWRERAGAVVFGHGVQRAILRNCRIENCWRGVEVSKDSEACVVENCEVVNCVDGIRFAYLRGGRVVNNRVVRRGDHWPYQPSKPSVGVYFYTFHDDSTAWIEGNYIEGYGNAIRLKVSPIACVKNNVMMDCQTGLLAYTGVRREFLNNLFVNCDTPVIFTDGKPPKTFVSDFNCVHDDRNPAAAEKWLQQWREQTGQEQHSLARSPQIVGTWPDTMFLSAESACVGAGQNGAHIGSLAVATGGNTRLRPATSRWAGLLQRPGGRRTCGTPPRPRG